MQVYAWWFNVDLSCLGRTIYARQFLGAKPTLYGDVRNYCFMSSLFDSLHHVNLSEVKRQTDPLFIKAVKEAAMGCLDRCSDQLLRSLSEPLSEEAGTKHLFATNFAISFHSSAELGT